MLNEPSTARVLIIDDTPSIHEDIKKTLVLESRGEIDDLEADLFDEEESLSPKPPLSITVDSAYSGKEGFTMVQRAIEAGAPYSLAIVDMRMPPGWDGVETIENIWKVVPDLHVIICTAYSDHTWEDIIGRLGSSDHLLVIKKPFDNIEIRQAAFALCKKAELHKQTLRNVHELDSLVEARTHALKESNEKLKEEMNVRERIEGELRLAQKLEAVGQLAAGVAHEINTPIQFVGDSIHFLQSAFEDLLPLIKIYQELSAAAKSDPNFQALVEKTEAAEEEADLEFLEEELPAACERASHGTQRVTEIVRAMKDFSHPDQREKTSANLNEAIKTTMTVAMNEYKYVADIETIFGEIPEVCCHPGEMNQVFLNLIVNASHAIADMPKSDSGKGTIKIETMRIDDHVEIRISDTGCGIPSEIANRVFDPFFTTKAVGKGTGQGLAVTRRIVVEKHGGQLSFKSEPGMGTTFFIKLPISSSNTEDIAA